MRHAALLILALVINLSLGQAFAQDLRHALVSELKGDVQVRVKGNGWQRAEVGMTLYEKDEIRTSKGAFAEILLDQGASTGKVEMKEKSHLKLNTLGLDHATGEKTTLLHLAIGKVLVHAEKLKGKSKFEVKTPTSTTGVRGTIFEVSVEEE